MNVCGVLAPVLTGKTTSLAGATVHLKIFENRYGGDIRPKQVISFCLVHRYPRLPTCAPISPLPGMASPYCEQPASGLPGFSYGMDQTTSDLFRANTNPSHRDGGCV